MALQQPSKLLAYLIIAFGFALGFFYNNQTDPSASVTPVPPQYELASLQKVSDVKIDYSLITSPQFKALQVFGSLPVLPGTGGKTDLFQ